MTSRSAARATPALLGVDFSCAPSRRKPITAAHGRLASDDGVLQLDRIDELHTLAAFEALLAEPGPWVGAFDLPFGLPREFVAAHGLGDSTAAVCAALLQRCATRMAFRAMVDAWGNARPAGQRLIHRATDRLRPALVSTSPLQTRYVPVGFMVYEGLTRLVRAGVTLPRLHAGDPARVALEAYPGLLAHDLVGRRSYKNSAAPDRRVARAEIVAALEAGRLRGGDGRPLRLSLPGAQRSALLDDASGDRLDAVLCLMQAAWAVGQPDHGVPAGIDTVEGWITMAHGSAC